MTLSETWACAAMTRFRTAERGTDDPTLKLLALGLAELAEAVRHLEPREPLPPARPYGGS